MKHRIRRKHFNRDSKARKALFKGLVRSLVEHGSIETTEAKAKEIKRISDKIIGKAKTDDVPTRRLLHRFFGRRDVVNTLVERVAPLFPDRVSGFTRITRVGKRRGDNSKMVKLSLVKMPARLGTLKAAPSGVQEKKAIAAPKKAASKKSSKPVAKKAVKKEAK